MPVVLFRRTPKMLNHYPSGNPGHMRAMSILVGDIPNRLEGGSCSSSAARPFVKDRDWLRVPPR